jgi:RNA polymerase sigma-70 factor (ECF subfamily)
MQNELPAQPELIRELSANREESLAKYFLLVRSRLRRVVNFRLDYRLSGRVSESDVLQETYVRAAKRIDSYLLKPEMPFFVWLRLETQQQILDIHRQHFSAGKRDIRKEISLARPKQNSGRTSMALAAHLVAQITSPSQMFAKAEKIAALEKTLNTMNELDREVIALRNFEELSNEETAEVLQIKPSAASKRYLRALKRLKEIMELAKSNS